MTELNGFFRKWRSYCASQHNDLTNLSQYCGKFVRQKLQPSWQCFVLYGAQAASASALFVQLSLHPLPHSFYVQYPPFLFTLCSLDATNIKIKGTFRLLNELFLSFSLTLYNVDCLLVKFCAI